MVGFDRDAYGAFSVGAAGDTFFFPKFFETPRNSGVKKGMFRAFFP